MLRVDMNEKNAHIQVKGDLGDILADVAILINRIHNELKAKDEEAANIFKVMITLHVGEMAFDVCEGREAKDLTDDEDDTDSIISMFQSFYDWSSKKEDGQ